jgi:hypothetical protein
LPNEAIKNKKGGIVMKEVLFASIFALVVGGFFSSFVAADDTLVDFKGGIAVIPLSSAAGTQNVDGTFPNVNRNVVRGVNPPGQIWRIGDLDAKVKTDGSITVVGNGLLLAGGNGIGTNAGASVFATLICEATAPFTLRNTSLAGVPLQANGDFKIDDVLAPPPTAACASPVLLIRNVANQAWFAAGIRKIDKSAD